MSGSRHPTDCNFSLELRLGELEFFFSVIQNSCGTVYTDKHSKAVNPVSADFELLNYSRSGLNRFCIMEFVSSFKQ